jgi:hypothetical protein
MEGGVNNEANSDETGAKSLWSNAFAMCMPSSLIFKEERNIELRVFLDSTRHVFLVSTR